MIFDFKNTKPSAPFGEGVPLIDEFWCIDNISRQDKTIR